MSRISRYQESIEKYFKSKSSINNFDDVTKNFVLNACENTDYFLAIILLTTFKSQSKKTNASAHCYHIAAAMENIYLFMKESENYDNLPSTYSTKHTDYSTIKLVILNNIHHNIALNLENICLEYTKDKTLKLNTLINKIISSKLLSAMLNSNDFVKYVPTLDYKKYDMLDYKFKNKKHKQKLSSMKFYSCDMTMQMVKDSTCTLCQLIIHISWLLGGGENSASIDTQINAVGYHLGIIMKIAYDFHNIDNDLEIAKKSSRNVVINLGIQESFELFDMHKQKYIEKSMILEIHTNTIKEIIDILAARIDNFIDNTETIKNQLNSSNNSETT